MSVEIDMKSLGLKLDKVGESIESLKEIGAQVKSLQDAVAEMQVKNAHGQYVDANDNSTVSPEVKGMLDYIAGRTATPETKTASIANPATGGYLAVPEFINQVVPKIVERTPLLQEITAFSVDADITSVPVETKVPDVQWVGEMQTRDETDVGLGMANIPMNDLSAPMSLTNKLIRSSNLVNAETYLSGRLVDALGRGIGQAILNGDGHNKPSGVLSDKRIKTVQSGAKAAITTDSLFNMVGDLPSELSNPKWVMSNKTFWEIVKVFGKDSNYVQMPLNAGLQRMILGFPVIIADAPAVEASAVPIVLGDFKMGYYGVQSTGMDYIRDPYTKAANGMTILRYNSAFGGQVVNPDCFRTMTIGA